MVNLSFSLIYLSVFILRCPHEIIYQSPELSCCHLPRLRINFQSLHYFPGDIIRAVVKLNLGKPLNIKEGLFIRFLGKEEVDYNPRTKARVRMDKVLVDKSSALKIFAKDKHNGTLNP